MKSIYVPITRVIGLNIFHFALAHMIIYKCTHDDSQNSANNYLRLFPSTYLLGREGAKKFIYSDTVVKLVVLL